MTDRNSANLLQAARSFEKQMQMVIGDDKRDIPFIIAIYNTETERIEFVTNMERDHYLNFIDDMHEEAGNPDFKETFPRESDGAN